MKLRILALLLALCLCLGTLLSCTPTPEQPPVDKEDPSTDGDTTPEQPETPPESTLPDDISVIFYTDTEEEKPYIHDISGNHFDTTNNRYFDQNFYIVYRFPTHAQHKTVELTLSIANQYEVSVSSDGKSYDVLASSLEVQQGAQKLILDLSAYRPTGSSLSLAC